MYILMFWFMNDWGLYGRAYEQIALTLANDGRVKHVTCVLPPAKATNNDNFFDILNVSRKLTIITPYWASINRKGRFYNLREFVNRMLKPIFFLKAFLSIKGYRKRNTILWLFPPHAYLHDIMNSIPHRYLVTQIVDNNTKRDVAPEVAQKISEIYGHFARIGNLVITSSNSNFDYFSKLNPNCVLIENGVSPDFIADPSELPCRAGVSRPRLGYVGFISPRTDLELLRFVAQRYRDCDLIIAGPDEGFLREDGLTMEENVDYLGPVAHSDLPGLLHSFDVCLIAHKKTPFSDSMSPLKLYQYLACGRPIVSTSVAGTENFRSLIGIAGSYEEFVDLIGRLLQTDTLDLARSRIERAKQESWQSRVDRMLERIEGDLGA